ncbi:MAG: NAD(P)H-dependent oxidoreductase [Polyangiaceae bacterium]
MSQALLLLGHPIDDSFNARLARAYVRGFESASGRISTLVLPNLTFDPVLRGRGQALEPDLLQARRLIEASEHLVWVLPDYWGAPPAVVRGFVDRVFLPGWAYRHEGRALPTGLLRGRSSRVVVTMDSPKLWYWLAHRGSIHAAMGTATLSYVGIAPVRYTTLYSVRKMSEVTREKWLTRMTRLGAIDAERCRPLPAHNAVADVVGT